MNFLEEAFWNVMVAYERLVLAMTVLDYRLIFLVDVIFLHVLERA